MWANPIHDGQRLMTWEVSSPKTLEDVMKAIGKREQDPDYQIVISTELMADIATRIIRLEEKNKDA
jgi:hypothetical protein